MLGIGAACPAVRQRSWPCRPSPSRCAPLPFPIGRQPGPHEVHHAVGVMPSMGLGLFPLPVGVGYYAACTIGCVGPDWRIEPVSGLLSAPLSGAIRWLVIGFL